jgi:hypothetical protein
VGGQGRDGLKEKKVNTINLPAYLQNSGLPDFTDRLGANLGTGSPPYVSIQGNRFTLFDSVGDSEPVTTVDPKTGVPYLDCVIIDCGDHESKIYYGHAFDPNASSFAPPDCWSDNGIGPSINCSVPQAPSCTPDPTGVNGCKWAVWGSATSKVSGKGIPACAKYQKLALLIPGDDVEFLLRVPPNSLENLRAYNNKFKGRPFTARDVVTRISFEAGGIGTLTFAGLDFIDEATAEQRNAVLIAKKTDALVGRGDKPRQSGGQPVPLAVSRALELGAPPAHIASSLASASAQEQTSPLSTSAPPAATSGPAPAASTTAPSGAPPARRRGRPPKVDPAATAGDPVAPFRQPEPAPQSNGQFGIASPPAPNADLEAALKSVFG